MGCSMKNLAFALPALVVAFVVLSVPWAVSALDATAAPELPIASRDVFSANDDLLIIRAIAGGVRTGTILIAAKPGRVDAVRERVNALGGSVKYEAAELGYVRARISLDRLGKLDADDIEVADFAAPDQFG